MLHFFCSREGMRQDWPRTVRLTGSAWIVNGKAARIMFGKKSREPALDKRPVHEQPGADKELCE